MGCRQCRCYPVTCRPGPDRENRRNRARAPAAFCAGTRQPRARKLAQGAGPHRHGADADADSRGEENHAALPRRTRPRQRAHDLADRHRLSRSRAAAGGMVRAATGFSQLSNRPCGRRGLSRREISGAARPAAGEMAKKPGLGASERCLTGRPNWPITAFRAKPSRMETTEPAIAVESPCQACGACCAYSQNWPRFTTEDDAALDLIPEDYVNERQSGMRCDGDRCSALSGQIGVKTSCAIYAVRPEVCRTCMPGDVECGMARRRYGLEPLS